MKKLFLILMLLAPAFNAPAAEPVKEQELVIAARKILDPWHESQPEQGDRLLQVVCWTPSDREFPARYEQRLDQIMKHIQLFYETEMERHGFGNRTFNLHLNREGNVVLHIVKGLHPTSHYEKSSGGEIREECLVELKKQDIDGDKETMVIFCNLADWNEKTLTFTHNSPYYAGGSNKSGTAWQLDSPELAIENIKLKQPMIQDGEYGRISIGKHNSIFIGGIAHEMGHGFGLPHCAPRPDEQVRGTPLMGSGNRTYGDEIRGEGRGTILSLAHAMRLASHPQFTRSVKGYLDSASVTVSNLSVETAGKAIQVSGTVKGEPPVYGVVAYFDPEGGGDYNSTTATAVPDSNGHFEFQTSALAPGKRGQLRIVPLHCNGALADSGSLSKLKYSYEVSAQGIPDVSTIQLRLELTPLLEAIASGKSSEIHRQLKFIKSEKGQRIAKRLVDMSEPTEILGDYSGRQSEMGLTSFKPTSVSVGWRKPTLNRIPDPAMLLESNGEIFETGLYAHAPARHEYALNKAWKTIKGKVGIAAGHDSGTVAFEIQGDGRTLWQSKTVTSSELISFDVNIEGVSQLILLTHATDDGASNDWGLWLEPKLSR
ncbi:NPCBM/NEW2 domain-containing protein [Rubinisphaera italica]|uniref:NPCBM/NEW2 domain protein n=1 Tax=Rubinisphaera italica TaxID=2527969 RepID=A0A5C5XIW3_9PLAN|nr:NPCBM/NEW2 domain-containing protein [Rubinisphaera italica]TWT62724.1 NPCBM/NEW2 domain protein [Rubinisphaera italica]